MEDFDENGIIMPSISDINMEGSTESPDAQNNIKANNSIQNGKNKCCYEHN